MDMLKLHHSLERGCGGGRSGCGGSKGKGTRGGNSRPRPSTTTRPKIKGWG